MAELGTANSLVAELLSGGRAKANNAAKLLALTSTCKQEAALKVAIQGLKQFFVAAGQDGLLTGSVPGSRPAKRQKVDGADAAAAAGATGAEAQYRDWLGRQYGKFIDQLLALITGAPPSSSPAPASEQQQQQQQQQQRGNPACAAAPPAPSRSAVVQVLAAAAVMECVRSEMGPGVFSGGLYGRLLSGVLLRPGVRPEVFALLFTKYLPLADVRFFTLATVKALASRYAATAPRVTPAEGDGDEEDKADKEEGDQQGDAAAAAALTTTTTTTSGGEGGTVGLPDLARNAYDVLCHVEESMSADPREWSTWCGATEYNLVTAAADKNESSRTRRKRKQQQQQQQEQERKQQQPPQGGQAASQQQQQQQVQWANAKTQKRLFGDAWLALLSLPLPSDLLRKALVRLPAAVIPHMTGPHLLADFLTGAINRGGLTGMLALNGLFLLVTRHGLEYPQFYSRLYQLLVPEAFAARTRAQFFRLADIFLSSGLVPAYTVAAFVKRFARLALLAPPAGAMVAIAFCHNLIRRHPALAVMLHNPAAAAAAAAADAAGEGDGGAAAAAAAPGGGGADQAGAGAKAKGRGKGKGAVAAANGGPGVDPYDEVEPEPAKSRAVESSLWEVDALRNHYCPQVSTFCAVLDKDLTDRVKTAEVNIEDLLGGGKGDAKQAGGAGSYGALIHGELDRKLRKVPVAFYSQAPTALFEASHDEADWDGWAWGLEVQA